MRRLDLPSALPCRCCGTEPRYITTPKPTILADRFIGFRYSVSRTLSFFPIGALERSANLTTNPTGLSDINNLVIWAPVLQLVV